VFLRIMEGLATADAQLKTIMIEATCLKAHRTASSLRLNKGGLGPDWPHKRRHEYRAKRRTDANRRPPSFHDSKIALAVRYDKRCYRRRSRVEIKVDRENGSARRYWRRSG
jgi:hypothetical protein